jgi:hypothetical protein
MTKRSERPKLNPSYVAKNAVRSQEKESAPIRCQCGSVLEGAELQSGYCLGCYYDSLDSME